MRVGQAAFNPREKENSKFGAIQGDIWGKTNQFTSLPERIILTVI